MHVFTIPVGQPVIANINGLLTYRDKNNSAALPVSGTSIKSPPKTVTPYV